MSVVEKEIEEADIWAEFKILEINSAKQFVLDLQKENERLKNKLDKILNDLPAWQREKYKNEN